MSERQMLWLVLISTILFWLGLYFSGFPQPMGDDLFFIGAAINLAKTGNFFNPLLSLWSTQTIDRFFVQPPFHSYTLAGWLELLGISTQSFLLFQFCCYNIFSIFTILTLRYYRFSWLSVISIPPIYATWMADVGLRQDALGMAYLSIGLWCLVHDNAQRYFWGFLFLGLAICTSPVLLAYAIPFSIGIIVVNCRTCDKIDQSYLRQRLGSLLLAILVVLGLLLWAIHFELAHFWSDMSWHASLRVSHPNKVLPGVLFVTRNGYGEIIYGSLYLTCFLLQSLLFKMRKINKKKLLFLILIVDVALVMNLFIYSGTLEMNFHFFCWFSIVIILFNLNIQPRMRMRLFSLCLLTFMIYQSQAIVGWLGQRASSQYHYQNVLAWLDAHPHEHYVIDEVAARWVFDYNLPAHSTAWQFSQSAHSELFWPTSVAEKPPDTIWLIAAAKAALTPDLPDYGRVELLGRRFNSVPRSPHQVIIVE